MKFVLLIEENGYQLRYWDQINDEIGSVIFESWDILDIYETAQAKNIYLKKKNLQEAANKLDNGKIFAVIESKEWYPKSLEEFIENDI